tara:strand:- start:6424 stop:7779 length:1356 start_codon:yes stop_codon:yes gene_type:complete
MAYLHTTFSTEGVSIPHRTLSDAEKSVVELCLNGITSGATPLENPVVGSVESNYDLASALQDQAVSLQSDPFSTVNYNTLISSLELLKNNLKDSADGSSNVLRHTNRISGAVLGPDGELMDFMGLTSIASSYNSIREAMKGATAPTEDNYSTMFTSVLGSGAGVLGSINRLLSAATGGTGSINPAINDRGVTGAQESVDTLTAGISTDNGDLMSQVESDNKNAAYALSYVTRFGLGLSLIGMEKDTAFGARLLDSVGSEELLTELESAVDSEPTISDGPFAIEGYYPLYRTAEAARAASPTPNESREGEDTLGYHIHVLSDIEYYMPNGLGGPGSGLQFHGDYQMDQTIEEEEEVEVETRAATTNEVVGTRPEQSAPIVSTPVSSVESTSPTVDTPESTTSESSTDSSSSSDGDSGGEDSGSGDSGGGDSGSGDSGGGGGGGGYGGGYGGY